MAKLIFNTGTQYLDSKEKEIQADFVENLPGVRDVFKKGDEHRMVTQITFPIGAITQESVFGETLEDQTQVYSTPCATIKFDPRTKIKEARVVFKDMKADESIAVGASEWMKWVLDSKKKVTVVHYRPKSLVSKETAIRLQKMKALRKQGHFGDAEVAPVFASDAAKTDKNKTGGIAE